MAIPDIRREQSPVQEQFYSVRLKIGAGHDAAADAPTYDCKDCVCEVSSFGRIP